MHETSGLQPTNDHKRMSQKTSAFEPPDCRLERQTAESIHEDTDLLTVVGTQSVSGIRLLVPEVATLNVAALTISTGAFVALLHLEWGMLRTLGVATVIGFCYQCLVVG